DADCEVVFSSLCPQLGYDPRSPIKVPVDSDLEKGCVDLLLENMYEDGCSSRACFRAWTRDQSFLLYELAAIKGQIDVLRHLPSFYSDIDQAPDHDPTSLETATTTDKCLHSNPGVCESRRNIITATVKRYLRCGHPPERLADVLKCQPCSEDVVACVEELLHLVRVGKQGVKSLGVFAAEFAGVKGAHSGNTLLMEACSLGSEAFVQDLLLDSRTVVGAKNAAGQTAFDRLFPSSEDHDHGVKKRIALALKLHGYERWADVEPLPEDEGTVIRKMRSQLCQYAWKPFPEVKEMMQHFAPVLSQDISFSFCPWKCRVDLFPDTHTTGRYPAIIFSQDFWENGDIFRCIERGHCPCLDPHSQDRSSTSWSVSFLPACAAIAAGNVELFRFLMQSFGEHAQRQQPCQPSVDVSNLKPCIRSEETTVEKIPRRVTVSEAKSHYHSGDLVADALRHALYTGHAREAIQMLVNMTQDYGIRLNGDAKVLLLDMALRVGDEDTFLEFVNMFGLNVRSGADGLTPLFLAVCFSRVNLARVLLQKGARADMEDSRQHNAIDLALQLRTPDVNEMVLMLLEEGVGLTDPDNPRTPTTMQAVIQRLRFDNNIGFTLVDRLVEKGEVFVPIWDRERARDPFTLHWAPLVAWCLRNSHVGAARHLVEKGLDWWSPFPAGPGDRYPEKPLHMLVGRKDGTALLEQLIQRGADVNEKNGRGQTPLYIAMRNNNAAAVGLLLLAGAVLDSPDELMPLTLPMPVRRGNDSPTEREEQLREQSFLLQAVVNKQANMVELALLAGYRAHREPWFVQAKYPGNTPARCKHVMKKLGHQVAPLTFACRKALRDHLGGALPEFLKRVKVPGMVEDFVLMRDLVDAFITK
ncbi:hypothetical protein BaRGS_00007279, partial [Batillaria attramentaria]